MKANIPILPYGHNSFFCFFHKYLAKRSICRIVTMVIIYFHQNPFIFMVISIISFLVGTMYFHLGGFVNFAWFSLDWLMFYWGWGGVCYLTRAGR